MTASADDPVGTLDLYQRIADHFDELLHRCADDRWSALSPCEGWTAGDVAAHVVRNHRRALAGLDGSAFAAPTADEDVRAAWREASNRVRAALGDPALADRPMGQEYQDTTFTGFIRRMACADTLIHSWDLARATGQDETLDAVGVAEATRILMPEDVAIRQPLAFGAKVAPAPDADAQDRLLNFLGRRP